MGINNIEPNTGRMLGENGDIVNVADLIKNIAGGVGVVKPTNYLYVSKGGNDSTGDGSANLPFATVQHALDIATSGTVIFIFPGSYNESITLKANVYLVSPTPYAVYITGNHTANFSGTSILANIVLSSSSGITLSYSGSNTQSVQLYNSSINSNNGDALNITNTGTGSKIQFTDCSNSVSTSGSSARCIYTSNTSKTTILANRTTFKVDNPNNVCIALNGASSLIHTSDQIIGQVTMADTSSATIAMVALTTTNVPVLVTNSSGVSSFINDTVTTTSSPAITGAGVHTFVAVLYTSTGVGGASTLNGGLGPIGLPMSSIKLRTANLLPSAQVATGQNSGSFEFDGTHLYFTIGTTRNIIV